MPTSRSSSPLSNTKLNTKNPNRGSQTTHNIDYQKKTNQAQVQETSVQQTPVPQDSAYLFIVVHTFDEGTSKINSKIVNVFETQGSFFSLGKTYDNGKDEIEYNMKTMNMIKLEKKGAVLKSKIKKQEQQSNLPVKTVQPKSIIDPSTLVQGEVYSYKPDKNIGTLSQQITYDKPSPINKKYLFKSTMKNKQVTIDFINPNNFILLPAKEPESIVQKPKRGLDIGEKYNEYNPFEQIASINDKECIFFYEYDHDGGHIKTYYTKGNIFIYDNGIGSTSCIYDSLTTKFMDQYAMENDSANAENIKTIILENNIFKITKQNALTTEDIDNLANSDLNAENDSEPNDSDSNDSEPIDTVSTEVSQTDSSTTQTSLSGNVYKSTSLIIALQKKCKDINILYANTILPEKLNEIIEAKKLSMKTNLFKIIVNQLYIDISAPNDIDEFKLYNELYKYIYSYYDDKNSIKSDKYDNELKKELKQFAEIDKNKASTNTTIVTPFYFKINRYINLLNDTRDKLKNKTQYEYANFSMHILDFLDFLDFFNNRTRELNRPNKDKFNKLIDKILNKSFVQKKSQVLPRIKDDIKKKLEEMTKGVYTYLKISNFQETETTTLNSPYNERFQIQIHDDNQSMIMQYSNINVGFYNKDSTVNVEKIKQLMGDTNPRIKLKTKEDVYMAEIAKIMYDGTYVFGNFNKIFTPKYNVKQIADELNSLIDTVVKGNPLFLMGWGASGTGKTSTLIYFVKKNEPGILIHLCNKLAKDYGYETIELTCKELFKPYYESNKSNNFYVKNLDGSLTISSNKFTFDYHDVESDESAKFKLTEQIIHQINHQYRTNTTNKDENKTFNIGDNIGKVIQYLIDDDRLVKATTNNPNSSRSHVLCFLKLKNNNKATKEANIIIGDLAGVENTFNCNNSSEISNFFNMKRDGKDTRFYKDEIIAKDDGTFDVDLIYGGDPRNLSSDEKSTFTDSLSQPFFMFNVENILKLYNYYEEGSYFKNKFSSPETAIKIFVNLILTNLDPNLNMENLNTQILVKGKKIKEYIKKARDDKFISFLFMNRDKNQEPHITIRKIIYGATGKTYNSPDIIQKYDIYKNGFQIWNEKNVEILLKKIEDCILYNDVIQNVCKNRVVEGTFINESLNSLSKDIVNIINFKNKDTIYFVPSFQDSCLPAYCPNQTTCFATERPTNFKIESIILKEIYNFLHPDNKLIEEDTTIQQDKESVLAKLNKKKEQETQLTKFYGIIEFCVFCVFNWSRSANNPPPVPYVDINELNQIISKTNQTILSVGPLKSALSSRIAELTRNRYSKDALAKLNKIYNLINNKQTINSETSKIILNILKQIDNTNATTAIGTIEFIDKISKLNTISNSCFNMNFKKDFDKSKYQYIYS